MLGPWGEGFGAQGAFGGLLSLEIETGFVATGRDLSLPGPAVWLCSWASSLVTGRLRFD